MKSTLLKNHRKNRRANSARGRLRKRSDRIRLSVFRSSKHIAAQVIDDTQGKTLCSISSTSKAIAGDLEGKTKSERAAIIGAELAKRAKDAGVETVVFDRGPYRYHGRVKALADAAREGGLKF